MQVASNTVRAARNAAAAVVTALGSTSNVTSPSPPSAVRWASTASENIRVPVLAPGLPDEPLVESNQGVDQYFGSLVFDRRAMQASTLDSAEFDKFTQAVAAQKPIDFATADAIAKAMLKWATERGATHYTHWFQVKQAAGNTHQRAYEILCFHVADVSGLLFCLRVCSAHHRNLR